MTTLLICPVRPGEYNEQLRHAARSWEKNLLLPGGLSLMIVGHHPEWIKPDHFVSGNHRDHNQSNVWENIHRGAYEADLLGYETAIVMNDDFFCMEPVDHVPMWKRNKTLQEHIEMFPQWKSMWFPASLDLTASWLRGVGIPTPDSYDLHRPLFCRPRDLFWAMSQVGWRVGDPVLQWRTVYGALCDVPAEPVDDVKLGVAGTVTDGDWISTSPNSWMKHGRRIANLFPEPSVWERRAY